MASGAGPTAVLNRRYEIFARTVGFEIDPCRPGKGSDKGKAERAVRTARGTFGDILRGGADCLAELQALLGPPRPHAGSEASPLYRRSS